MIVVVVGAPLLEVVRREATLMAATSVAGEEVAGMAPRPMVIRLAGGMRCCHSPLVCSRMPEGVDLVVAGLVVGVVALVVRAVRGSLSQRPVPVPSSSHLPPRPHQGMVH